MEALKVLTCVIAFLLAMVLAALFGGCGSGYEIQCAGAGGIDCELVNLPLCTSKYGDSAPAAHCTSTCETDEDCPGGVCAAWRFPRGTHKVCVSQAWAEDLERSEK